MPRLSDFQSQRLKVDLPCDDEPLTFEFYPAKFTRQLQSDLAKAEKAVRKAEEAGEEPTLEQSEVAASILVTIFAGWNLTDDKGKDCPCTVRFLVDELGYFAIGALLREVYDRLDPQRRAGNSPSSSSPPATQAESRRNAKSSSAL